MHLVASSNYFLLMSYPTVLGQQGHMPTFRTSILSLQAKYNYTDEAQGSDQADEVIIGGPILLPALSNIRIEMIIVKF